MVLAGTVHATGFRADLNNIGTPENLRVLSAGLGIAAFARSWDDEVRDGLRESHLLDRPTGISNVYGSSSFNIPVSFAIWGVGKTTGRADFIELGSGLLRTLALTQLVVAPTKVIVGRERPDGSNNLSFPSGHTANSVAIARFLHRSYGGRLGLPLYIFSCFVAAGRIQDDRHFLSDVIVGAAIGGVVGNSVAVTRSKSMSIAPTPAGLTVTMSLRY
jgi:membrane-associated phospholipid phosphatase